MNDADLIQVIEASFAAVAYPGERFLLGSNEGSEPASAVAPFMGVTDWGDLDAQVLDHHHEALSYLSDGGLRFFLPAFLVADVFGQLETADPTFHLTNGFSDQSVSLPVGDTVFERTFGKSALLNPRRYGAMTNHDYACYRLSVFAREEVGAIVAYLENRRVFYEDGIETEAITAALDSFWLERAQSAPTQADIVASISDQDEFIAAFERQRPSPGSNS